MIYREDDLIDNTPEEALLNPVPIPYETRLQSTSSLKISKSTSLSQLSFSTFGLILPVVLFVALYTLPIFELYPTEHTSLAIVISAVFMWCFDTDLNINSYIVSYIIPILAVWLRVGIDKEKGTRIPAPDLSSNFTFIFMSPEILTILGSITLIAAIDKYKINKYFCYKISTVLQPYPRIILFSFMLMNAIFGFLFSTIASTTIFVSLAISIIRSLDANDNFSKALLLGIAWSGNCSSLLSIHLSNSLPISKLEYFIYAMPSAIIICSIECFFLMKVFKLRRRKIILAKASRDLNLSGNLVAQEEGNSDEKAKIQLKRRLQKSESANNLRKQPSNLPTFYYNSNNDSSWEFNHYLVITIIAVLTFFLTISNSLKFVGHDGIISLLSIVLIFGCGILTTNEFNTLSWSTISIAGGGLALCEVMKQSGLFELLFHLIFTKIDHLTCLSGFECAFKNNRLFQRKGFREWLTTVLYLVVFSVFSSIFNDKNYMIDKINGLWSGSPIIISVSLMMVNVAQLLPVSTFSNLLVMSVVNEETKEPILSGSTFMKYGIASEFISIAVLSTLGYYLAYSLEL